MVAWANHAALERTLEVGETHFWSRSRQELWHKGATSGNTQRVVSLHADCDGDTILARVVPDGPACHTGETTCFGSVPDLRTRPLEELWQVLDSRARERPEGSYTTRLLDDENLRLKKLGEETAELITALSRDESESVVREGADLLYHLLVALLGAGLTLEDLTNELDRRRQ
jgi:phosphoribosyl-ATP pyrophosphohydrolase/phosphoribosyl-AMP cyclohydrolase